jgi:hypothetical protein
MTLFEARANLLPAPLTRMEKPLCSICIFEQQQVCLFAEGAVARFYWNRHMGFFLDFISSSFLSQ